MNIPGDWSWKNLKSKAGGLLDDPNQLLENPMFGAGMGLLSSNYDGRINPYQAALGGMAGAQQTQQANADRAREQELREKLAALMAGQQQGGGQMPAPGMPQPPFKQQQPPLAGPVPRMPGLPGQMNAPVPTAASGDSRTQELMNRYMWQRAIGS